MFGLLRRGRESDSRWFESIVFLVEVYVLVHFCLKRKPWVGPVDFECWKLSFVEANGYIFSLCFEEMSMPISLVL